MSIVVSVHCLNYYKGHHSTYPVVGRRWWLLLGIPPDHGEKEVEAAHHLAQDVEGAQGKRSAALN